MFQPLCETVWQFLTTLNIFSPYEPAIVFFDIYPIELKTYVHTETYTWIFIAALFITARTLKQLKCLSVGEWINYGTYISEYYVHNMYSVQTYQNNMHNRILCSTKRK